MFQKGDNENRTSSTANAPKRGNDTPVLDKFGNDMTRAAEENRLDPVIGRDVEIERLAVAPMHCISPRARAGLRRLAASIVPEALPAPTIVWSSSIKSIMSLFFDSSLRMAFIRSSNCPRYFVPATIDAMSSDMTRLPKSMRDTFRCYESIYKLLANVTDTPQMGASFSDDEDEEDDEMFQKGDNENRTSSTANAPDAMSSDMTRLPKSMRDTFRCTIRNASPSTMADLPTPGSPISTGLFFLRRLSICARRSISTSRPITGSRRFSSAARVM